MKPSELIRKVGYEKIDEWEGYADETKTFKKYLDVDCVIGYEINSFGCLMLIKGAKKCFVFVVFKKMFIMPYHFQKVVDIHSVLNEINFTILNEEAYTQYKKQMILKNLK